MSAGISAIYRAGNNVITDAYLAGVAEGRSELEGVRLQRVLNVLEQLDALHQECKRDAVEHDDSLYDRGLSYAYSVAAGRLRDALKPRPAAIAKSEAAS